MSVTVMRGLMGLALLCATLLILGCESTRQLAVPRGTDAQQVLASITDVKVESRQGGVQIIVTSSKSLGYGIRDHEDALGFTVDIPQAEFDESVDQAILPQQSVKSVHLSETSSPQPVAHLNVKLIEQANYSITKEPTRLVISIGSTVEQAAAQLASPRQAPQISQAPQMSTADVQVQAQAGLKAKLQNVALPTQPPSSQDYRVGPRDLLNIEVYDEPDLTKTLRVSESGFINFPLVGRIKVQGLTPTQIARRIEHLLSKGYLLAPQAFVEVAEFESQKVFILGAVSKPISFTLRGTTTLLELLAQTGKLGQAEDGVYSSSLVIFRHVVTENAAGKPISKESKAIHVDLDRLLLQGDMSLNVVMQAHDVIYVPEPDSIFVLGQVGSPGPIALPEGGMTLMEAITKAGGLTELAFPSRTKVLRVVDGKEEVLRINAADIVRRGDRNKDIMLKANDVVVIPQSIF